MKDLWRGNSKRDQLLSNSRGEVIAVGGNKIDYKNVQKDYSVGNIDLTRLIEEEEEVTNHNGFFSAFLNLLMTSLNLLVQAVVTINQ